MSALTPVRTGADRRRLATTFAVLALAAVPARAQLFWTAHNARQILRTELDGSNLTVVVNGIATPWHIDCDPVGGKIYWTDVGSLKVQRANFDGTAVEDVVTNLDTGPDGVAVDTVARQLYYSGSQFVSPFTQAIYRSNLDGTSPVKVFDSTASLSSPEELELDMTNQMIYFGSSAGGEIDRVTYTGASFELVVPLIAGGDCAVDPAGGKFYFFDGIPAKIVRANLNKTNFQDIVMGGFTGISGVDLDVPNGKIYWSSDTNGKIERANLDGTNRETLATGLSAPFDIAVCSKGGTSTQCPVFADTVTFPPTTPAKVAPWVYKGPCGNINTPPPITTATSGPPVQLEATGGPANQLRLYQLDCACGSRILVFKSAGQVKLQF